MSRVTKQKINQMVEVLNDVQGTLHLQLKDTHEGTDRNKLRGNIKMINMKIKELENKRDRLSRSK